MSMGSEVSSPAMGAGMSQGFNAGGAAVGGNSSMALPGGSAGGMDPSLMMRLGSMLKDPAFLKSMGDIMKSLGGAAAANEKMPKQHDQTIQDMMKSFTGSQSPGAGGKGAGPNTNPAPFRGDASFYISPEQASSALSGLGIPFGG